MEREPEYVLINTEKFAKLTAVHKGERTLLLFLIKNCKKSEEGLITIVTPALKKQIMEVTGWKNIQSFYNAINRLCKIGMIRRIMNDVYVLDPDVFVKKGGHRR